MKVTKASAVPTRSRIEAAAFAARLRLKESEFLIENGKAMPAGIRVARKGFAAIKETGNLSTRLRTIVERYRPARRRSKQE